MASDALERTDGQREATAASTEEKAEPPWQPLTERLRALGEDDGEDAASRLRAALADEEVVTIALALDELPSEVATRAFDALDEGRASKILSMLGPDATKALGEHLSPDVFARLVAPLPLREAASTVVEAPSDGMASAVTRAPAQPAGMADELDARLRYPTGSIGRLMTTGFVRLDAAMTAHAALDAVRATDPQLDIPSDLFVVEPEQLSDGPRERLVGVVSIRDLTMARPDQQVGDIMATDPVAVPASANRIDAASLLAKHAFLALPALDAAGYLVGVVPVDDLLRDVVPRLRRLYNRSVGTDAETMAGLSPMQAARRRVPWLLATLTIELGAGLVITHFDAVLTQVILLASFMPVISAISGNVGLQAAAITVRALDSGQVAGRDRWAAVRNEAATTALMAMVCGLVLGGIGMVWSRHVPFGLVIGGALACAMLTAAVMGTVIPAISKRLGFDPATTAGPFETAFQDVVGFGVFLWLASMLAPFLT